MRLSFTPLLILTLSILSGCSTEKEMMRDAREIKYQNITLSSVEGSKKFRTTNDLTPKVKTKMDRWYHWYHSDELHLTAGNFSGRLLDGDYTSFFIDGTLKEKGEFKMGLKTGEWMMWYKNGQVKEVADFKKGEKHGDYASFDQKGNVMIEGVFKKGTYAGLKKSTWRQFVDFITFKKMRTATDAN